MNTFITYKNLLSIKFILLLCGSIIFIIKTVSVYQEKHRSWNILTKVFYVFKYGAICGRSNHCNYGCYWNISEGLGCDSNNYDDY